MLKRIKINFEVIELMDFYWNTIARQDKLPESYLVDISQRPEMQAVYTEGFNDNSVRKALSAINNGEPLNEATDKETEFYRYNKFFADDPGNVELTLPAVKTLNLDRFLQELQGQGDLSEIQVNFVPAYDITEIIKGNTLTINFFKLSIDMTDFETVRVGDLIFEDYLFQALTRTLAA